ncbi:MAG: aspartate carbamoyltransferase catalytic subunit [Candidatus Marinimicrobia bacterium]|nr:aspartate carbamoyltransferase catalytic subunit [Candidatus Neomarinimicrobiota bacterium]
MSLSIENLLGLEDVPQADINQIFDAAFSFREVLERPVKKVPTLKGTTVVNLFFEPSTRTKNSFALAEKRLSADTVNFSAASSSLQKGESLKDTIQNLCAMKIDLVVMRHPTPGSVKMLADFVNAVIINAGDGTHEHPTQALLDIMSLKEKFGQVQDLNVAIIGDIKHSRVALSNIYGLKTMGANVMLCAPPPFMPVSVEDLDVKVTYNVDEALEFADAVNVLRIQKERQASGLIPSLREYRNRFGITLERVASLQKPITILHPGPMNRQVEIDSAIADGENAIILDQVLNGVAVRMAVLFLLSGS